MKKLLLVTAVLLSSMFGSFAQTTWTVRVGNFAFMPATLNVAVGDVIRWRWHSGMHTTTSLTVPPGATPWDVPIDSTNIQFKYRVRFAGTYTYECSPHPFMQGTINATLGNSPATLENSAATHH
jgi:plastocyanin